MYHNFHTQYTHITEQAHDCPLDDLSIIMMNIFNKRCEVSVILVSLDEYIS